MKVRAADVMVTADKFPAVDEDEGVDRAAAILVRIYSGMDSTWRGYESLIVRDKLNREVGFLTLRSILKAIGTGEGGGAAGFIPWIKKNAVSVPVKSLMRPLNQCFVRPDDGIEQAVRTIMENNANSVLVMDGDRLAGVIRTIDLFWYIPEML